MSKILDAVVDARDDEDEAQMRSLFYGAGGFDSDDEDTQLSTQLPNENLSIRVQECRSRGIAHQVWPAATFLSEYIAKIPYILHQDTASTEAAKDSAEETVFLELGAGVGVTGVYLHKYFRSEAAKGENISVLHTVLTDLEEAYAGLQDNIRLNSVAGERDGSDISAAVLPWGDEQSLLHTLDTLCQSLEPMTDTQSQRRRTLVVLAADVIYWECLFDPLLDCIIQLLQHTTSGGRFAPYFSQTRIIIAHYKRWKKDQIFLNRLQKRLQKHKLGSYRCLHEDILNAHTDAADETLDEEAPSEGGQQLQPQFSTKKEIRRIYLIQSL
eukprot:gene8603-6193_t